MTGAVVLVGTGAAVTRTEALHLRTHVDGRHGDGEKEGIVHRPVLHATRTGWTHKIAAVREKR